MSVKLYVLIRADLPSWQVAAVQAGHAVAQLLLDVDPGEDWKNGIMVYLRVDNEVGLQQWFDRLRDRHYSCSAFYEYDLNDEMTAIAVLGGEELLKDLPLL
jgi:hypothetical protein